MVLLIQIYFGSIILKFQDFVFYKSINITSNEISKNFNLFLWKFKIDSNENEVLFRDYIGRIVYM